MKMPTRQGWDPFSYAVSEQFLVQLQSFVWWMMSVDDVGYDPGRQMWTRMESCHYISFSHWMAKQQPE
jgi:hypothetical protein